MSSMFSAILNASAGVGGVQQQQNINSSSSAKAQWFSIDPRTGNQVAYAAADSAKLESAYQNHEEKVVLTFGSNSFTVVFAQMAQFNEGGGHRSVVRQCSGAAEQAVPLTEKIIETARAAVQKMDEFAKMVEEKIEPDGKARNAGVNSPLNKEDIGAILAVYQHILEDLQSQKYKGKFQFNAKQDAHLFAIRTGEPVPPYFANVHGQSIFQRKYLSALGLRNLVTHGVQIFSDMLKVCFSGDPNHYESPKKGPGLLKTLTGTVIDLDSVTLRASDPQVVQVVNASLAKEAAAEKRPPPPTYTSGKQLAYSSDGKKIAYECAKSMIDDFIKRFGLNEQWVNYRNVKLPASFEEMGKIPTATDNSQRNKWPMWLYDNVEVLTYHVNVPTMYDIYLGLLKAPFHLANAYLWAREQDRLDDFFSDGLADSCINAKGKAIEEFIGTLKHHGTICDVLNEMHKSRTTDIFTAAFYEQDDDEGTKELEMMQKLVASAKLKGVDENTRVVRDVTPADVKAWHQRLLDAM